MGSLPDSKENSSNRVPSPMDAGPRRRIDNRRRGRRLTGYPSDTTKGSRAIVRARLMATVISRWCLAQFPVIRRGMILPRSVVKSLSVCESLYSIFSAESVQKRQNFRR